MLSALFVSTEGFSLGSIDVSDACLQVEQVEPTIVTVVDEDRIHVTWTKDWFKRMVWKVARSPGRVWTRFRKFDKVQEREEAQAENRRTNRQARRKVWILEKKLRSEQQRSRS